MPEADFVHAGESGSAVPVEALELFAEVLSQSEHEAAIGDDFYDRLCGAVCRLAHLRRAIIFRYDPASRQVRAAGAHGLEIEGFTDVELSVDTAPFAAQAIREDKVVETEGDVRAQLPAGYTRFVPEPARMVCGPMVAAGRAVGVIVAERSIDAPPLDPSERHLLWTLGKAAALASVARNVATQAETARQLRQRIDLAREVHEGVIQRLFGISMVLDGAGDLPEEVRARCASEIQAALGELRDAIQRPLGRRSRATQTTFAAELARVARTNLDFSLSYEDDTVANVPEELEPLAQSVLAEAIRNVRKHAQPTEVRVSTAVFDGAFVLEVTNDGVPAGRVHPPGMGLRLAAFEALQCGGIVEFGPLDDGSWRVRLVVPHDA
ncbi:MAG TPA: GAF domain-containing protein [Solirubrobacteraceae bacterium]|jgi:signal transduction histidine kinase|nr:GAF domain-containing protein [Solirubrobacteraceae bacterium]